ncbi:porin [Marinobacterium jannaschii]|uniref:porin n=1 Tax=Marinobacterium jannaschii TaxID=64970 RepID=UPI00047FAB94|nr:porin [Marinobacterium jannaschii]
MKKLVLAAAVIAATTAGSASAVTIYEGKGLTYKLKGDWQIQLRQDVGNDQNLDVEFDDLELKNSIAYDLGNDMTAFGQLDFGFKDAAENKQNGSDLEEAYVGLQFGNTAVAIGKQNYATDEFGVEAAYELKLDTDGFEERGTDGDDVIRVDVEMENFTFIASHDIEAEGESSESGQSFDLFAATSVAGLELAAAYQSKEAAVGADSVDTFGVSAAYKLGSVTLAADYSSTDDVADYYNVVAVVKAAKTTKVALGLQTVEPETGDEATEWYANVTYKFPTQKNVSVFAEIADTDEDNVDLGFLTGMRIKF